MGLPRNYSHITVDNINHGRKYHVTQDELSILSSMVHILTDIYSKLNLTTLINTTVAPGETKIIDTFPGDQFFACDWYISAIDDARSNMKSSTIKAVWNYQTNNLETDETFTYVGDFNMLNFNVDMVSGHVRLFVVNSSSASWTIQGRREFI